MKYCFIQSDENDYSIRRCFSELLGDEKFSDVTLATNDGYEIKAHKVILSAGSSFFYNVLKRSLHPNPFMYMKGIQKEELLKIVEFLYLGEAKLAVEDFEPFMETAKELQLKGLQSYSSGAILVENECEEECADFFDNTDSFDNSENDLEWDHFADINSSFKDTSDILDWDMPTSMDIDDEHEITEIINVNEHVSVPSLLNHASVIPTLATSVVGVSIRIFAKFLINTSWLHQHSSVLTVQ